MDVTAPPDRWLLRRPDPTAAARIFCFPYSGIGASMFRRWPRRIGPVEVVLVQPPGRENRTREPHFGSYPQLAAVLAEQLRPWTGTPYVLFGHCAAALPAYETARRLIATGQPAPARLVVSAQVPPHHGPHDRMLGYDDERLAAELRSLVVLRGGEPHPLLIELTLGVLKRDLAASRAYRHPEPARLPAGITVLHWADDPEVTEGELAGWRHYSDDVRFAVLPGGHWDFLGAPAGLRAELARAAGQVVPA